MRCVNCGYTPQPPENIKGRSNRQSRYFHGVLLPILAEYTGYTEDEMKAVLKFKFKVTHTSCLSTAEFEIFCSNIRKWASAELSCYLPEPNEKVDENA